MDRRALLALLGTTATAGCSTVSGLFGGAEHTALSGLTVHNRAASAQQVAVQVLADEAVVMDETLSLTGESTTESGADIPCDWRDAAGPLTVRVRPADGSDWSTFAVDEASDAAPSVAVIGILGGETDPSEVVFYTSTNPSAATCSTTTPGTTATPASRDAAPPESRTRF